MRPRSLACLVVALCAAPAAFGAVKAPKLPKLAADIPKQSLAGALGAFGEATGLNVIWPPEMEAVTSRGATAGAPPAVALKELLRCTTLRFTFENQRTVNIFDSGQPDPDCTPPSPIEEVTITGTRWEQRITETPNVNAVWDPALLEASGVKGIADIAALTPGVSFDFFSSVGSGIFTDIVIRGISDRHGSATGIFIDDTPLPAARSNTFGRALPPYFDLDKIEILRGPQGTLQGAYTQGGAVRFTSSQPDLDTYSGFAHGEWAFTERGRPSYELGAASGGPLKEDVLGFRFSAWQRSDGGYVNRVNALPDYTPPFPVVDSDANRLTVQSLRGVLEYDNPGKSVKVSPSITYVSAHAPDSPSFFTNISNPGAGELNNGSLIAQPFDDSYIIGSLRVIAALRAGQLDSRTSYYHRKGDLVVDDSQSAKWGYPDGFPTSPDNLVATYTALRQSVFSQELRLSPDPHGGTTWTAGASFYKTRDLEGYHVTGQNVTVERAPNVFYVGPLDAYNSTPTVQTQFGLYGELTQKLAKHFGVDLGLRLEYEEYEGYQTEQVAFITPSEPVPPQNSVSGRNTVLVPRIKLTYTSTADEQYYLLAARGYSPAGIDAALPTCFQDLQVYPLDTVWSYELGTHRAFLFLDQRFTLAAAVFDARWNNGPTPSTNCLVTHISGSAVSRGFDLKGDASIGSIMARLEVSYVDAHYTQTTTVDGRVIVNDGDALGTPPLVASPWNVLASLEQRLDLRENASVTLRAEDSYHSHNPGPFYTSIPQPNDAPPPNLYAPNLVSDPATNLLNLRMTVDLSGPSPVPGMCHCKAAADGGLSFALFLNNALDSQPTLLKRNKGADNVSNLFYATTFRPRTVGLSGTWRF
jgi:outer membrane receptor protein involved in Fe transport